MHSGDWLGALIVGGIIGAILAKGGIQNDGYYTADY
jgi:hypothetical protein